VSEDYKITRPQPGAQEAICSTIADIAFGGVGRGGARVLLYCSRQVAMSIIPIIPLLSSAGLIQSLKQVEDYGMYP